MITYDTAELEENFNRRTLEGDNTMTGSLPRGIV